MGEIFQGEDGGVDRPREAEDPAPEAEHATDGITIQEAIRLTARFDKEWFRSFDTLDADLSRFAAAFHLSPEEVHQVRRVVEALHEDEAADRTDEVHPSLPSRSSLNV